jgi:protein disulfide-isomerase A6
VNGLLQLDEKTFDEHVGGDKPSLVEFYAPWCGKLRDVWPLRVR